MEVVARSLPGCDTIFRSAGGTGPPPVVLLQFPGRSAVAWILFRYAHPMKPEQTTEKRYYISLRGVQAGPFTHAELHYQPVRRKTLVWNEDEWAWIPAGHMAALAGLFPSGGFRSLFR